MNSLIRRVTTALVLVLGFSANFAQAQLASTAPGFVALPKTAKVVIMPIDVELYSISAGGVLEQRADWTRDAQKHLRAAIGKRNATLGLETVDLTNQASDELSEVTALYGAVAQAMASHHGGASTFALPTKEGKLDWALGDALHAIRDKTGARYGFFTWVRDSYASQERIALTVGLAFLGVVRVGDGGQQIAYSSLVDLESGQVAWFGRLARGSGDLRTEPAAAETVDTLLRNFPQSK
jgi:hypothetical protein